MAQATRSRAPAAQPAQPAQPPQEEYVDLSFSLSNSTGTNGRMTGALIGVGVWLLAFLVILFTSIGYGTEYSSLLAEQSDWAFKLMTFTVIGLLNFMMIVIVVMIVLDGLNVRREFLRIIDKWFTRKGERNQLADAIIVLSMALASAMFLWSAVYFTAQSYIAAFI